MRKRMLALVFAIVAAVGASAAMAGAHPGPHHGNNKKGLCTAYFNGSDRGREQKRTAPPFAALEEAADDGDDETSTEDDVRAFCEGYIGGKPDRRG